MAGIEENRLTLAAGVQQIKTIGSGGAGKGNVALVICGGAQLVPNSRSTVEKLTQTCRCTDTIIIIIKISHLFSEKLGITATTRSSTDYSSKSMCQFFEERQDIQAQVQTFLFGSLAKKRNQVQVLIIYTPEQLPDFFSSLLGITRPFCRKMT
jgi:hypothetical protein